MCLTKGGHQKKTIGSGGSGDGQFIQPRGIFIKGDVIYIAECGNNHVQKLTTGGQFLQKFGQKESAQGQFKTQDLLLFMIEIGSLLLMRVTTE